MSPFFKIVFPFPAWPFVFFFVPAFPRLAETEKVTLRGYGDGCIRKIPLLLILEKYFGEHCLDPD